MPASGPSGLSTSSITSTGVQLAWLTLPETEQNGIIIGYSVFLAGVSSDDSWNFTVNSTSLSVLATLEPHTSYKFSVAATTVVGSGPFSEFSFFTTKEDCKSVKFETMITNLLYFSTCFKPSQCRCYLYHIN